MSIRIRGYDDPDLHLPLAALASHLSSRDVAMKGFVLPWAVRGMPPKKSLIQSVGVGLGPPSKLSRQGKRMEQLQDLGLSPMSAFGAALLRFILAGFWITHWWFKVGYRGMTATEAFFLQQGLPAWLAWFVVSFEVVVAACLMLGIYVPLVCLVSLPILFASMWIYRGNGFFFSSGGIELPTFWACAQIVQVLLGPGAFRIPLPAWLPDLPTVFGIQL